MRRSVRLFVILVLITLVGVPAGAHAQADVPDEGFLLRVDGNVQLTHGESIASVVVINGDALIQGTAASVVVVDGAALLVGATVRDVVVVGGRAVLEQGSRVSGDLRLWDSELVQAPDATVAGTVYRDTDIYPWVGGWLFAVGIVFFVGVSLLLIVAAVIAALVAGTQLRAAATAVQNDIGWTLLAALVLWIIVPILATFVFITLVGIPTSLVTFFFLMPALWFLGYVVSGAWVGILTLRLVDRQRTVSERPVLEAVVGMVVLQAIALIPVLGAIIAPIAGLVGGGAVVLVATRAVFGRSAEAQALVARA